ncbi:hypothetical protein GE21DRAFT_9102 [Neurospora crassa]|uniref:Uncharacterized protein n=1 Tax=Neurospora crassa (strain ATCC 24698 / 74-OR23-1A / CBS 708.71 / DSM 1257 / FGSC 987) TaxID=367110 RepID=V5IL00_NEUCR|nr:hypothetical protein NCU12119 [Neurospora crassa OR74A]ESA42232.1 hypothetical protein NCU12119 [Neurospora crassa OR74A]KHE78981.1 hypothetical protein GE21DRAFT_9102 [Neurospora crassa]|eukprot:XP_011395055.1 hypothetical protein NCU12119 [Neurospora crassa OR74A]
MSISTNKSIKINVTVTNSIRTVLPPTNSVEILKVRTGCQGMSAMIPRDCDAWSTILAKQVIIVIFWVATEGHIDVARKYQDDYERGLPEEQPSGQDHSPFRDHDFSTLLWIVNQPSCNDFNAVMRIVNNIWRTVIKRGVLWTILRPSGCRR